MTRNRGSARTVEEVEARLVEFIEGELLTPGTEVHREDDLLSGDFLDSVAVLRLATFVAEEFDLEIQPADFVIENFRTVAVLTEYVRRSIGGAVRP